MIKDRGDWAGNGGHLGGLSDLCLGVIQLAGENQIGNGWAFGQTIQLGGNQAGE